MVEFQFMSGINTIGGNIIDIRSNTGRVIFDFGEIVDPSTGALPDLTQLTEETAIFISHLHIDHIGSLKYVPENVPVYMSKESVRLYQKLIELGEELPIKAKVKSFEYDTELTIGDIKVIAKESDHDIRGVSAFFVHTPDVKFIYSADVRLTGNFPEKVYAWLKDARAFQPDVFLLEGTTYSFDDDKVVLSEAELLKQWNTMLAEKNEIIILNTYIRDTVRLVEMSKAAKEANRIMVLDPKYASILKELEDYKDTLVLKELDAKNQFSDRAISLETIQQNPNQYILHNSFENRFILKEFKQGIYVHSNGEPLGDYDPRFMELMNLLETGHFTYVDLNAGGHATKEDLIWIAKEVDATVTFPWHSQKPEALHQALLLNGISSIVPEPEVVYSLDRKNKYKKGGNK